MNAPKKYLNGIFKKHTFQNGGSIVKLSFKASDLTEFVRNNSNARGYLNVILAERREVGKFGETHSIYLDDFEPKQKSESQPAESQQDPFA